MSPKTHVILNKAKQNKTTAKGISKDTAQQVVHRDAKTRTRMRLSKILPSPQLN